MEERIFEDDIRLDRFALEMEAEKQSSLYHYWSDLLADAKFERDEAIDHLSSMEDELDLHYRIHPKEGVKATEASIKAMVGTDPGVITAKEKLNEVKRKVNQLEGDVKSLEQKHKQIENLQKLWIAGYYSFPEGGRTSTDDKQKELRNQINKKKDKANEEYVKGLSKKEDKDEKENN